MSARPAGWCCWLLAAALWAGMTGPGRAATTISGDVSPNPPDPNLPLVVGNTGIGTMTIDGGSSESDTIGYIGFTATGTGTVTVTGAGSQWNNGSINVGFDGAGTLFIFNGATVSGGGAIGANAGSNGQVLVVGGSWVGGLASAFVGTSGTGSLTIQGGGTVGGASSLIGFQPGSSGTVLVEGTGSSWFMTDDVYVGGGPAGAGGTGSLTVNTSAVVSVGNIFRVWNTGTIAGNGGTIIGNITSDGTVAPGSGATTGTLSITGNYTQNAAGTLQIDLGGTTAGQFDVLSVSGAATFGGTLDVTLINAFGPQAGDSFDILDFGSASGSFSTVNLPALGAGLAWDQSSLLTTGVLSVVSTALPGDFDLDGDVDAFDFGAWQANFPTASGATLAQGDADGDGDVDAFDFGIWQANFPSAPAAATAVPEPVSAALLGILGGMAMLGRPAKKRFSIEFVQKSIDNAD